MEKQGGKGRSEQREQRGERCGNDALFIGRKQLQHNGRTPLVRPLPTHTTVSRQAKHVGQSGTTRCKGWPNAFASRAKREGKFKFGRKGTGAVPLLAYLN